MIKSPQMNLSMTGEVAAAYKSGSQRARVVTEAWGESNLYCPNCSSSRLKRLDNNTRASDFSCPECGFWYQLKGQKTPIRSSITDGAYESMMDAIRQDKAPSYYFLHYDLATWNIRNLLLIPHFAFPASAIIKRKPLSATARRHGWVGCNFALDRIPIDPRISVVRDQIVAPASEVREAFRRVKPLSELLVSERGWTLDVLNVVRKLTAETQRRRERMVGTDSTPSLTSTGGKLGTLWKASLPRRRRCLRGFCAKPHRNSQTRMCTGMSGSWRGCVAAARQSAANISPF